MTTLTNPSYLKPYTSRATYRCDPDLKEAAWSSYREELNRLGIPFGTCFCTCLTKTGIPSQTVTAKGFFAGLPHRYARGHRRSKSPVWTIEEDRGYTSPCFVWQRARNTNGYGAVRFEGETRPAHVVAYIKYYGPVPEGLVVHHKCEVPLCVNPEHLMAVTNADNIRFSVRAQLNKEDVMRMFSLRRQGMTWKQIAVEVGTTYENARAIGCGLRWGDVREEALRVQDLVG